MEIAERTLTDLEGEMLKLPQVECSVIHRFGPGMYIRELHMPADTLSIGHYQKIEHMNVFLKGRISMIDNGSRTELKAPMIFTAPPGRKMGYVLEDVVWLNIYSTEETDLETLENTYLDKSNVWESNNKLDRMKRGQKFLDTEDYKKLPVALDESENNIVMPFGSYKFLISKSNIDGKGVFASAGIESGEEIGLARINGKMTPLGRYINHSINPNAKMINLNNGVCLVSTTDIVGCKGGFTGEEITINYRNNLKLVGVKK
jgi:hypothetical protein